MSKTNTNDAPKRGLSAYFHFSKTERSKLPSGLSFGEVGKELSSRWKALTEKDRGPYDELAAKDKTRYEREKTEWKENNPGKQLGGRGKKNGGDAPDTKTKTKRKLSGYLLFGQDERLKMKSDGETRSAAQTMTEIATRWRALADDERSEYNEKATRV